MQQNPFAPPSELADVQGAPAGTSGKFTGVRVYSPNQVLGATFLGSPIASAWLMSENFVAFRNPNAARRTWLYGILATAALLGVSTLIPDGVPTSPIAIAYAFVAKHLVVKYQARDIATVLTGGGSHYSSWRAAGLGLLSLLALMIVVVGVMLLLWGFGLIELE